MINRKTVLIVDDESKIRRLLSKSLEIEGFDVAEADSGINALKFLEGREVDLIVLDYMMPEMDGLEFLEKLRKTSEVPVIMLSAREEVSKKTRALELGADDYVVKPFSIDEINARIRAVLRRTTGRKGDLPVEEIRNGDLIMNPSKRICKYRGKEIKLADTEFRVLLVLVRRPGTIFTHEDLLRRVWGPAYIGDLNYLRVSLSRVRKKLMSAGFPGTAIASYSGIGYYIEDLSETDV